MLLGFGTDVEADPDSSRRGSVSVFDVSVPVEPLLAGGIVIVLTLVLAALYRWTPFGLATRAASENEIVGDARRPLREPALDGEHRAGARSWPERWGSSRRRSSQLGLDHVAALDRAGPRRGAVRPFHVARDRLCRRAPIGVAQSLLYYASTLSLVPDRQRHAAARHSGAADVRHHRARSLPARRQPADAGASSSRNGCRRRRGRNAFLRPSVLFTALAVLLLIVLPFDYRQALMLSPHRDGGVPVARGDHRFRWPGLRSHRWRWRACPGSWCHTSS